MNQRVAFHTLLTPKREGDDIQVQLVTIRWGQGTLLSHSAFVASYGTLKHTLHPPTMHAHVHDRPGKAWGSGLRAGGLGAP